MMYAFGGMGTQRPWTGRVVGSADGGDEGMEGAAGSLSSTAAREGSDAIQTGASEYRPIVVDYKRHTM